MSESRILAKAVILVMGIALIVVSAGLWIYTSFNISMRERTLADVNLKLEERWQVEGSLSWWRDKGTTILYPTAALLLALGLVALLFALLLL